MLLSIIIPVYNVEPYLIECLESVFTQDIAECEIISINDGSTDNSRRLLSEYKIKQPELIIIDQENFGLCAARNLGLKVANGEYVYFLDSDDYILPGAIKQIISSIEEGKYEVVGFNAMANGNTVYIPSFNVDNIVKSGIKYYSDFYKDNGFYPFVNVPNYVYRRSFLYYHNLTFKVGLYHEDILFSLQVFYHVKSLFCFNIPIYNYRQNREGSICTDIKLKNIIDKAIICRNLDAFFQKNNFNNIYFYNSLFQDYIYLLGEAIANKYETNQSHYFNREDSKIMRRGVQSDYEYKLWVLASVNIRLMVSYYENRLPQIFRRSINILFSLINKLHKLDFDKNIVK